MHTLRTAAGVLLLLVTIAGCATPGASGGPTDPGTTAPRPTAVPGDPGNAGGGHGGGAGSGGGIVGPPPAGGINDGAAVVLPKPGRLDPHPVNAASLDVVVDGTHVSVRLTWWSGVEPCYVLDSVDVKRDGGTITLTIIEGHDPGDVACIEIAQLKATVVGLGDLEPGTYVIKAQPGDAAAITVDIS